MPKTYPAYFGTYGRFGELRSWIDRFDNLFLIGRNGMHRYNNMDHSMLTAMVAVENILEGRLEKANLWDVNAEQEYHEVKKDAPERKPVPRPAPTPSTNEAAADDEPQRPVPKASETPETPAAESGAVHGTQV
ncbi:MAG: hypothetical protein ACYTG0_11925 [Planctomycetota bacterium]|jgi:hypothetical protein